MSDTVYGELEYGPGRVTGAKGELGESTWEREEGVLCVVCPECAFTFDASHEDMGGGYSCPLCVTAHPNTGL